DLSPSTEASRIQVPTLMLWGQQDPHISYEMAPLSIDLCEDGRLVTYEDATHWVLHDKSAEVSQEMVAFFSAQEKE
ncbi:MAG: alpha/beta hydrolase, partial [Gammaproteobacteria bacterium]|nr:alpha/beta hydrolase [Gammaproteobacteria bacterium]